MAEKDELMHAKNRELAEVEQLRQQVSICSDVLVIYTIKATQQEMVSSGGVVYGPPHAHILNLHLT